MWSNNWIPNRKIMNYKEKSYNYIEVQQRLIAYALYKGNLLINSVNNPESKDVLTSEQWLEQYEQQLEENNNEQ